MFILVLSISIFAEGKITAMKIGLAHCADAVGIEYNLYKDRGIGFSAGIGLIFSVVAGANYAFFINEHFIIAPGIDFGVSIPESFPYRNAIDEKFRPYLIPRIDFNYFFKNMGPFVCIKYPLINRPHNVQTMTHEMGENRIVYDEKELSPADIVSLGITWRFGQKEK
jgi:hypothetical protein